MASREFDIIVYGATGFTGRLVAEYLTQHYAGRKDAPKWAMAGRSAAKLAEVRDLIGAPKDTPLVVADASDPATLDAMAPRATVILTTVGPYQLYGNELVAACVKAGTAYADLCGEPGWMREMIDEHEAAAKASGARITFSCGFDSIPFDLGVHFLQAEAVKRHGKPAPRVKGRVRKMAGGASGGTIASLTETLKAVAKKPSLALLLKSSFALTPGFEGPSQPTGLFPEYDSATGTWTAPFVMAPINTKNVHRTNFLLGHAWGTDLVYDEMVMTTIGDAGKAMAEAMAKANPFGESKLKPGEGPSKEERENGFYDILFIGEYPDGTTVRASVQGDRDPGYGSTSKMLAETGIALLANKGDGGVWTPGALLGDALIARLTEHAGLTFQIED
ncbi:MAG: saccharopine dehydrogenase NADP-binding domain-containing protein [Alphaproteobacteria bacterium]|nr:saccharopine dehydrogenase NADP-binding domain-containing protein [Alphaproteobacteria bacterium]MBU0863692.1 saccharopine dehydrogenase NADP-binding domain-containing protein [Alphaproteobacteria bacterium]MBU1823639.1 saccharopine dehydrogenase NADP-binding domain-containing protein [Alphaproteobacteria bacterium]